MERKDNIVFVCSDCTEKRKADTQVGIDLKIKKAEKNAIVIKSSPEPGIYVKNTFTEDENVEHMWVFVPVSKINYIDRTLTGILENDPILLSNIKHLDEVKMSFDDVEEIYSEVK